MSKKTTTPIFELGDKDDLTFQKSLPLFSLWQSDLTLAELKMLDIYLSRIDRHKPEKRTVIFAKGEIEKLFNIDRIKMDYLEERLKHLGTPVQIRDISSTSNRFAQISLFEKAVAEQDKNGLWKVELTASQSAMKYFFNIENLAYLRYKLRCIMPLTSRYSYIMFMYVESNRYRKSWEVSVDELKKILTCDEDGIYQSYKYFRNKILNKVQKELREKTECHFEYESIKNGRSVVALRITVTDLPQSSLEDIDENQITIDQ